jgi:pyrroloquinoline-quinone synthase
VSLLDKDAFVARLRGEGSKRYHDQHPFHRRMHEGALSRRQIQGWVRNRFYYQTRIPIKDAIILSKCEDAAFRRSWIRRIQDHDGQDQRGQGTTNEPGGIELWLRLGEGVGIEREELLGFRTVLPAVRFACDAYVSLVRERSLVEAVASSLTELFSPELMSKRIVAWEKHYPWVKPETMAYFRARVPRAPVDSQEALAFVLANATTRELQEACLRAFITKCDILWALLDAVAAAYPDERPVEG